CARVGDSEYSTEYIDFW
nr:immunoglobulin heavy chain junction region [Macaca mulatta]MOV53559.1 immunoglobulin heavy chain junction region [Macaca mulatta]MOV53592.1 immunoglobulin heavy chain junction region [Macaca mulatta]MOV54053.1 immunoglobulin heavy chain junction region [Macaca mulatta]MOV54067.1 immunoglobulin heavy chain junction region [Macaca mulatta]